MAAHNAVEVGAKLLMLTHFSSRFVEDGICGGERKEEDLDHLQDHVYRLQKEAEEVVAQKGARCTVRCAADFHSVFINTFH